MVKLLPRVARRFAPRVARRFASGLPPLGVLKLRDRLDAAVIGQGPLKECLVLALIAKEHVYVEGPPGAAKTLLAETAAAQAQLTTFFCQLHRDTRLSELVGDAVIMREAAPSGGELIRSEVLAGGLLTADVAVLDDISRAPGEALNVLLRLLNERRWHARPIPLLTAIATGNPTGAEFYNEPLDPATLDRFAFQLRCDGLLGAGEWDDAAAVIDRFSSDAAAAAAPAAASTADAELAELQEAVDRVRLTPEIRDALLASSRGWRNAPPPRREQRAADGPERFWSRRQLLRAAAVAAGRDQCEPSDLDVLKYPTAFRVPERCTAAHVQPIIDEVAEEARREREGGRRRRWRRRRGRRLRRASAAAAARARRRAAPAPTMATSRSRARAEAARRRHSSFRARRPSDRRRSSAHRISSSWRRRKTRRRGLRR